MDAATEPISLTHRNAHSIAHIRVDKLFGQYTYQLPRKNGDTQDLSHLFILYGDNGSGKTTILRLLYNLLSPEDAKGHKTEILEIPFKRFSVELVDGTTIEALRTGSNLTGSYRAAILRDSVTIAAVDFPARADTEGKDQYRNSLRSFLKELANLEFSLHLLSDDRRMRDNDTDLSQWRRVRNAREHSGEPYYLTTNNPEWIPDIALKPAVISAQEWIGQQAFRGSSLGQRNVHAMYTDIAVYIADSPATLELSTAHAQATELIAQLKVLSASSEAYSTFGLTSELPVEKMVETLSTASPEKLPLLCGVLKPYARSIEARLKALEGIHKVITKFLENINIFFGDSKRVDFSLRTGLIIYTKNNHPLDLDKLSSGEKQLLLLMCATLSARDRASIFIIDEPEISLNIKWQRRLIQALLDCISGSNIQLMFASHSIELLSKHKRNVVKLIDNVRTEKKQQRQETEDE